MEAVDNGRTIRTDFHNVRIYDHFHQWKKTPIQKETVEKQLHV